MRRDALVLLVVLTLGWPAAAAAQSPARIPLQGTLSDSAGTPVSGTVSVRFALFTDAAGQMELWSETRDVTCADDGSFATMLGTQTPIALQSFASYGAVYLGVTVGEDEQMPLIELGTVPWAGYAAYCGGADTLGGMTVEQLSSSIESNIGGSAHDRYTDQEAVAAMGETADLNPLNHNRFTPSDVVSAVGGKSDTNPLNHDRYTDTEAVAAVAAAASATYASGFSDWRNNGATCGDRVWCAIPERTLDFDKASDASLIKITYTDTLGTHGPNYDGCRWRILVDGTNVMWFSAADGTEYAGAVNWKMAHGSHMAIAPGLAAGAHTVTIESYRREDRGTTECLMGWNQGGNSLLVEELP